MDWGSSLAWMIISPIVIVMDISCIFSISHYRNSYHGTDTTLIMVIIPMILNAILTLPIPAILTLAELSWTNTLCSFYVWAFCTLRMAQIFGLLCLSLQWAIFLRIKGEKQAKTSTLAMPWIMLGIWILSGVVSILPLVRETGETYYHTKTKSCEILPYDWGIGFAMFFIISVVAVVCSALLCLTDASLMLRHMRRIAVSKYRAERFHAPSTISNAYQHDKRTVQDRYTELNFTADLCHFVFIFIVLSAIINHLPFTVIQCLQLFHTPDRATVETITLWLILADSLVLPNTLWAFSKRYRHGLVYLWKVHILKNTSAEEGPAKCMLQSYVTKSSGVNGTARGMARIQNRMLQSLPRGVTANMIDETGEVTQPSPARKGLHQVFPEGSKHQTGEVTVHARSDGDSQQGKGRPGVVSVKVYDSTGPHPNNKSVMSHNVSPPESPAKRFMNAQADVQRSSSRSRQEWVEQMRRKHLPAIFVNDAYEKDDSIVASVTSPATKTEEESNEKRHKKVGSNSSLYYLSGEYHPDNLTSSFSKQLTESESDAASNQYDTVDISTVLDERSSDRDKSSTQLSNRPTPPKKPIRKQQSLGKYLQESSIDLDDSSIVSDKSVVLTPCFEQRRPLWLDEAVVASDTESALDISVNPNFKHASATSSQRSNSPSIHFDEDVDKGFEEALAIGYAAVSGNDSFSGTGTYFEAIQEDPAESHNKSADNNPFSSENLEDTQSETSFVTKAVVSKRQRNYSSESDNPFDKVPMKTYKTATDTVEEDVNGYSANGDSGTGTWTDYSNGFVSAEIPDDDDVFSKSTNHSDISPVWPDGNATNYKTGDMSFDSDFSDAKIDDTISGELNSAPLNGNNTSSSDLRVDVIESLQQDNQRTSAVDAVYF